MNKKWAELNKTLQSQLKKEETFADGVQTVLRLRQELFDVLCQLKSELTREEFNDSPYLNAEGYHSKTIAYSIWHIFRIEDIVAHTLIRNDEELFIMYPDPDTIPNIKFSDAVINKLISEIRPLIEDKSFIGYYNYFINKLHLTKKRGKYPRTVICEVG